ncbi:hypothetical protein N7516_000102 [Penicillium verrucosum]|uniref:uncharacterized protein n=1 Tax=Penicillium verrucosum TaxID=60171 RepID=UPI002544FB29|nr:uncharacterized protein N7516_000102 [Penicillium verrucosum]KAJ5939934.1 hypothetical protein N7516_000102 [Penicillium verrucosum]
MEETDAIASLVRTESRKIKKLPSKVVTDLEAADIPRLFSLKGWEDYKVEIVSLLYKIFETAAHSSCTGD